VEILEQVTSVSFIEYLNERDLRLEVFELRYARMPEEPPTPVKKPVGSKLKKIRGISSESSDESSPEDTDSSSSEESESESERANQLSYLQKQVRLIFQFSELRICYSFSICGGSSSKR